MVAAPQPNEGSMSATDKAVRIIGGVLGVILLLVLIAFVAGLGPFHRGPSAAAKLQPKVEKAVGKTQAEVDKAVDDATLKVQKSETETMERMDEGAAELRSQEVVYRDVPGPVRYVPGKPQVRVVERRVDVPDDAWRRRLCEYKLYAGSPACSGDGGPSPREGS
jgi:hypothetical protein